MDPRREAKTGDFEIIPEIGTLEIGTMEIGIPEIGTPEIGIPEIGTLEIGTLEIGTSSHFSGIGQDFLKFFA